MENKITFSQAVEGFMLSVQAGRLSPYTIKDYMTTYRKFEEYLEFDPNIWEGEILNTRDRSSGGNEHGIQRSSYS